jgi:hypothetical protein
MKLLATALVLAVALAVPVFAQQQDREKIAAPAAVQAKPVVQIAILLDTSSSMNGLIEQAKTQLWKIVNEFAKARQNGAAPDITVALYQYGTPSLGQETGYIRQLVPLTDDLDKVSEELFKLRTSGGEEYCGAVIRKATDELSWSPAKNAYKAIFIAGNEPFNQGSVDFRSSCKDAIAKGIIVNTIFCGSDEEGVRTLWKDGAVLADGSYVSINQNAQVVQAAAPQDKEIAELGAKLNTTYVAYGAKGEAGLGNQTAQDGNAATAPGGRGGFGGAAVDRSITKAQSAYRNGAWDLVDAVNEKRVDLSTVKKEELPREMQELDEKGRAEYIATKARERTEMQARINTLAAEREKYLAEQAKDKPESTLDQAVLSAVRTQAVRNGMTFDAPRP